MTQLDAKVTVRGGGIFVKTQNRFLKQKRTNVSNLKQDLNSLNTMPSTLVEDVKQMKFLLGVRVMPIDDVNAQKILTLETAHTIV